MAAKKVLIIGPAWVGDAVMAQSLYKTLLQQDPEITIDVLAPSWSHQVLERMPEVRKAWTSPFGHGEVSLKKRFQLGRQLAAEGYDQAIVLPNSLKSALVPFWAKIKQRTGWRGEARWGLLNDLRYLDKKALPLMIQRFISLGLTKGLPLPEKLPWPSLQTSPRTIEITLEKLGLTRPEKLLAICPGAEYGPSKRWPAQYYAEVANRQVEAGWAVWIFGSAKDSPLAKEIQTACGNACVDLTGKTELREAIDLMSLATAVVTNDSGLMHIAAALNRPLIALYGSSSPHFTPPLSDQVEQLFLSLDCRPCFNRSCPLEHFKCLRELMPEQVIGALAKLNRGVQDT